jgi:hypothetical protein
MSDIFLSYASADRERVRPLVTWLQSRGWSVWWDRAIIPGQTWDEVLAAALAEARCVLAIWTQVSIESDWVRIEASEGKEREILIPILLDDVEVPLAFRLIQAASLVGWSGDMNHPALAGIAWGIETILKDGHSVAKLPAQPAQDEHVEPRVLDAAICNQLPVREPADLIAMIRCEESGGLRAILEFDEEYALSPSDVASKPFELEFPIDHAGKPLPAELLLRVKAPDFDPPSQEKKVRVPPGRDSVVCAFLIAPQLEGTLPVQLEVFHQDAFVASRLLRPTGIPSGRPAAPRAGVVVSMPLQVFVQKPDSSGSFMGFKHVGGDLGRETARPSIKEDIPRASSPVAKFPISERLLENTKIVYTSARSSHPYLKYGAIAALLFVCISAAYLVYMPTRSSYEVKTPVGIPKPKTYLQVSGDDVQLRNSPSETGLVLQAIPPGTRVEVKERSSNGIWCQVRLPDDVEGWIPCESIESVTPE